MRQGFSLVELLLVVMVSLLLLAIALPRLPALTDQLTTRDETLHLVAALDASREAAVRLDRTVTLVLTADRYQAFAILGTDSLDAWHDAGPARSTTAISGAGQPITFGPSGLATGVSNRTFTLVHGSATARVVMSKLGRLTY